MILIIVGPQGCGKSELVKCIVDMVENGHPEGVFDGIILDPWDVNATTAADLKDFQNKYFLGSDVILVTNEIPAQLKPVARQVIDQAKIFRLNTPSLWSAHHPLNQVNKALAEIK